MRKLTRYLAPMRALLVCVVLGLGLACGGKAGAPGAGTGAPAGEAVIYTCPMQCKEAGKSEPYTSTQPGQCPVCGMNLEPKK